MTYCEVTYSLIVAYICGCAGSFTVIMAMQIWEKYKK